MVYCNSTLSETHWNTATVVGGLTLHTLGWMICGFCAIVASSFSFFLIHKHATHYSKPNEQRHIIRILLMIPIYAVTSWLSYVWYWHAIYWEVARDCYEAFAIAAFFALLCNYIAPDLHNQKEFFATMKVEPWPWPVNWINKCCKGKISTPRNGLTWFNINWFGIFQYCFIRVAMTIIATATQATGHYCEDSLSPAFAHVWVMLFEVIAVSVAMYCLIAFYMNLKNDLAPNKPFFKLLCIKLVIFFSFWQMIILDFLSSADILKSSDYMSPGDISVGLNSLLICFEMIIFAILHLWAFPWRVYELPSAPYDMENTGYGGHKGGKYGIHAYLDAFNPLDTTKAFARGLKWVLLGRKRRQFEAEKVIARKESKRVATTSNQPEERMGLVGNAARPGFTAGFSRTNSGGVYAENGEGLQVYHPNPNDTFEEVNNQNTSYDHYRSDSEEFDVLSNPAPRNFVGRPDYYPDPDQHPAYAPGRPSMAADIADLDPIPSPRLPYPNSNYMPSLSDHQPTYPLRTNLENAHGANAGGYGLRSPSSPQHQESHELLGYQAYRPAQYQPGAQGHARKDSETWDANPRT